MTEPFAHRPARLAAALAAAIFAWFASALDAAAWEGVCLDTAARVNAAEGLPAHMLGSIAITESGRLHPDTKAKVAWPWTVTSGGEGQYFPTKAAAIAEVKRLKRAGVENIDVGCMQINLKYHRDAFPNLEAAFDPETNVRYAANFLKDLREDTDSWAEAVRRYHSKDPERSLGYAKRVAKNYYALTADPVAKPKPQPVQTAQRTNAKHGAIAPPPVRVADAEELARKRAEARAEATEWRRKQLEAYLARRAAIVGG